MAGKNILKAWHRFLQTNFNVFKSGAPSMHKERKYEHMEIQKDFEEIEKKRQLSRLTLIEHKKKLRKQLIEKQLGIAKAQSQSPEITENLGRDVAKEVKHAEDVNKYSSFQTFEKFAKNLDETKRQIGEDSATSGSVNKQSLEKELAKLSLDLNQIQETKQELEKVERELEDLEPDYILVTGTKKKLILNMIAYYEFQVRNLQGVIINPDTLKSMEVIHYHVEHNLPVKRVLLYEVVPELFEVELGELDEYERDRILAKRPRFENRSDAIVRAVEDVPEDRTKKLEEYEEYKKQEIDFREFVYTKAIEFTHKHGDYIDAQLDLGYHSTDAVLEHVEFMDASERTELEQIIFDDLQELKRINDDYAELIKLNQAKVKAKQRELYVPDFIKQNDRLHQMWIQKWEELISTSFDFNDSLFVPEAPEDHESKLDRVLKDQQLLDINELIEQSQEEYKIRAGSPEPTKGSDRALKDNELLKKLDVLTGAMHQVPHKLKAKQRNLDHFQSSLGHTETSEEGRLLLDELTKVLYLNNKDPKTYNLIYWAEHFNIEPQKLRNIFNFVTFGLPDQKNASDIGRVLRFIYDNSALTEEQQAQVSGSN